MKAKRSRQDYEHDSQQPQHHETPSQPTKRNGPNHGAEYHTTIQQNLLLIVSLCQTGLVTFNLELATQLSTQQKLEIIQTAYQTRSRVFDHTQAIHFSLIIESTIHSIQQITVGRGFVPEFCYASFLLPLQTLNTSLQTAILSTWSQTLVSAPDSSDIQSSGANIHFFNQCVSYLPDITYNLQFR